MIIYILYIYILYIYMYRIKVWNFYLSLIIFYLFTNIICVSLATPKVWALSIYKTKILEEKLPGRNTCKWHNFKIISKVVKGK